MRALTRVTAARPSAEPWKTACGLKKAILAPTGNGAGGCAGTVAGAAGGWAGAGVSCAGLGAAGVCANTGAALIAISDRASDAAIAEPLIALNSFRESEALDFTPDRAKSPLSSLRRARLECRPHREAELEPLLRLEVVVADAFALRIVREDQAE